MERMKRWIPMAMLTLAVAAMLMHGPIAQLAHYHEFADARVLFGLPNAADVLSNIGFALVGLWGFFALHNHRHHPMLEGAWPGYCVFLAAITLTALGSSFFHLAPDNDRLLWDRLPIALACAGLLAAVRVETRGSQSRWVLPGLIVAAVVSVLWWSVTESFGSGDLRPYLLMQGAPLVLVPIWHWIHDAPRADRTAFGISILLYALAKAAELNDHRIFETLGSISGHTIKHLLAVMAAAVLTANLARRVREPSAPQCVALYPHSVGIG